MSSCSQTIHSQSARQAEKVLKRQGRPRKQTDKTPSWLVRARHIAQVLGQPLEKDDVSPILVIPPRDPGLKPASVPLALSAAPLTAPEKRPAGTDGPTAKRPRTDGPITRASLRTRSPSASSTLSELTPVPDSPVVNKANFSQLQNENASRSESASTSGTSQP